MPDSALSVHPSANAPLYTKKLGSCEGQPVVVYLHGLFGQGKNFNTVARRLLPEYDALLVDLPNHGRSARTEVFSYTHMAHAVAETIHAELGGQRVHVVGHSMGGKVAMLLALHHPDVVDRLVVEDMSPVVVQELGQFDHLLGTLRNVDLATITDRAEVDRSVAGAIPNQAVRHFLLQNLRQDNGCWYWLPNLELLHSSLSDIGDFPAPEATFDRPVLWLSGQHSTYVQPEHEPIMSAFFPRVINVTMKNAGHWIHSEQPDAFVQALRVFFAAGASG